MCIPPLSKLLTVLIISTTTVSQAYAQPDLSQVSVSASLLRKHVFLLASDSLRGRETGTEGQLQAAFYCAREFRKSHLLAAFRLDSSRGTFRQTFPFTISEVALFGNSRSYGSASPTYKRHELAPIPLTANDSSRVLFGDNVCGLIIGTDLKKEVIVVSAHYDHLWRVGG